MQKPQIKAFECASATAYLTDGGAIRTEVLTFPGHRDGPIEADLAEMAARVLGRTVAVLEGIHLERPTGKEIERIVAETIR